MLDKAFGAVHEGEECRPPGLHAVALRGVSGLWASDISFNDMKKVSNANPQQADYIWGKAELVQYSNADGKPLRAILDQAGQLRSDEEIPADGLHLRGALGGPAQLQAPAPGRASTSPATSATATSC